jgi:hypothetical protein
VSRVAATALYEKAVGAAPGVADTSIITRPKVPAGQVYANVVGVPAASVDPPILVAVAVPLTVTAISDAPRLDSRSATRKLLAHQRTPELHSMRQ